MNTFIEPSHSAIAKIKEVMEREGKTKTHLRIRVLAGGCAGFSFGMAFDPNKRKDDIIQEKNGVKFVMDKTSVTLAPKILLDYTEGLQGKGFMITNPEAKVACHCGTSFRPQGAPSGRLDAQKATN